MIYTNKRTRKKLEQIERLKKKAKIEGLNKDEQIKVDKETQLRKALERSEDGINYNKPKGPMTEKTKKCLEKKRKQKLKRKIRREEKAKLRKREEEIHKREQEIRRKEDEFRRKEEENSKKEEEKRRKEEENRRKRNRRETNRRKSQETNHRKRNKQEENSRKRNRQETNYGIKTPADIREFINNGDHNRYKSTEYKKLLMKYHPDKNPTQTDLYTYYTQLLNQKKKSLSTD